jgi:hypothetical protein
MHAHEEETGLIVTKLRGVENVAARVCKKLGDPKDNALSVRARQGKDKIVMHQLAGLMRASHGQEKKKLVRPGR